MTNRNELPPIAVQVVVVAVVAVVVAANAAFASVASDAAASQNIFLQPAPVQACGANN